MKKLLLVGKAIQLDNNNACMVDMLVISAQGWQLSYALILRRTLLARIWRPIQRALLWMSIRKSITPSCLQVLEWSTQVIFADMSNS